MPSARDDMLLRGQCRPCTIPVVSPFEISFTNTHSYCKEEEMSEFVVIVPVLGSGVRTVGNVVATQQSTTSMSFSVSRGVLAAYPVYSRCACRDMLQHPGTPH